MKRQGLSNPAQAHNTPYKFAGIHWTKPMGKPSSQKLKANCNVRRMPYVRR